LRLLPQEIFRLLGQEPTSRSDRTVLVTARAGGVSITEKVTFKALAAATYTNATSPVFGPLATQGRDPSVTVRFDLRGLRGATSGVLLVSDIDRALPRAFPDRDINSHGFAIPLSSLVGSVSVPLSRLQGAGVYGLALRGVGHGVQLDGLNGTADSTSSSAPRPLSGGTSPTSSRRQGRRSSQ
jgi:hypothetical protein